MAERAGRGMLREGGLSLFALAGLLAGLSCGGGDIQAPTTGSIEITTATSGPEPDADGYAVSIDDQAETPIGTNATLEREGLEPGSHSVRLTGMAANCTIAGENPRTISVPAGETTLVTFQVTCSATATTGAMEISTTSTGGSPDPDGYTVAVDDGTAQSIGANATLSVPAVTAGAHRVTLGSLAANCRVEGSNPLPVVVTAGATASAAFNIACAASSTSKIAFVAHRNHVEDDFDADLYVMNGDGSAVQKLTRGSDAGNVPECCLFYGAPSWSPDGKKILFLGTNSFQDFSNDVYVIDPDGANLTNLSRFADDGAIGRTPAWSPDGRKIAYTKFVEELSRAVHTMDADGMRQTRLTFGSSYQEDPDWSPNGTKIVYVNGTYGNGSNIELMNADGTGVTQLAHFGVDTSVTEPFWSPDGRKISFRMRIRPLGVELWVMNPDGSGAMKLTNTGAERNRPMAAWSPDGSKIAVASGGIQVMNRDGTGLVSLGVEGTDPAWSPDGTKLAFMSPRSWFTGYMSDILIVNANGTGLTNLTNSPDVDELYPAWSP